MCSDYLFGIAETGHDMKLFERSSSYDHAHLVRDGGEFRSHS
jgi:hypothetical protein